MVAATMATGGLKSPQTLAGMSEMALSRWSRELHSKAQRVQQALAGLEAAAPAGCSMNLEQAGNIDVLRQLAQRLAEHRVEVEAEQEYRRQAVRHRVAEQHAHHERMVDAQVSKALADGDRRIRERREELLEEATRRGEAYQRRLQRIAETTQQRQEEATAQLLEATARNEERLRAKRAEVAANIEAEATAHRREREAKAARAEARRAAWEDDERLRQEAAQRLREERQKAGKTISDAALGKARKPSTGTVTPALEGTETPQLQGATPSPAMKRLWQHRHKPTAAELNAVAEMHVTRAAENRAVTVAELARRRAKIEALHEMRAGEEQERRDAALKAAQQREEERQRRFNQALAEQQRMQDQMQWARHVQRVGAMRRCQSSDPTVHYEEANATRQMAKAVAAMTAICEEILGTVPIAKTPPPTLRSPLKLPQMGRPAPAKGEALLPANALTPVRASAADGEVPVLTGTFEVTLGNRGRR
jgi:hypothetical protein